MSDLARRIGHRRSSSWWEPTYDPSLDGSLEACSWDFSTTTGPKKSLLVADALEARLVIGEVFKLSGLTFTDCDFQGDFKHRPSILIDDCRFLGCDFAFSSWTSVSFRKCKFSKCSISIASFTDCEFRDCEWSDIGFSGNRTSFERTFVNNPRALIKSGYSAPNPSEAHNREHVSYQRYRLEGTKAHLARTLLYSHERVGDDKTYYKTAELHDCQQTKAQIAEGFNQLLFAKKLASRALGIDFIFWSLELFFTLRDWVD